MHTCKLFGKRYNLKMFSDVFNRNKNISQTINTCTYLHLYIPYDK